MIPLKIGKMRLAFTSKSDDNIQFLSYWFAKKHIPALIKWLEDVLKEYEGKG